jgi:hypothetical protein
VAGLGLIAPFLSKINLGLSAKSIIRCLTVIGNQTDNLLSKGKGQ